MYNILYGNLYDAFLSPAGDVAIEISSLQEWWSSLVVSAMSSERLQWVPCMSYVDISGRVKSFPGTDDGRGQEQDRRVERRNQDIVVEVFVVKVAEDRAQ